MGRLELQESHTPHNRRTQKKLNHQDDQQENHLLFEKIHEWYPPKMSILI